MLKITQVNEFKCDTHVCFVRCSSLHAFMPQPAYKASQTDYVPQSTPDNGIDALGPSAVCTVSHSQKSSKASN